MSHETSHTRKPAARGGVKKILFNATHPEELRVAVIEGRLLRDVILEPLNGDQRKANIYRATVTRVEPSLEAAFVNYGQERHGFLPLKEVEDGLMKGGSRRSINDYLKEGQEILVQVEKEERGAKGAALTTRITLAGSFLVLMPNSSAAGGISRRIEGDERSQLKELLAQLEIPEGMSVIIRTAGIGRTLPELQWDLDYLLTLWQAIKEANETSSAPALIHQEGDASTRALRDYLRQDVDEIWIDDQKLYDRIHQHMERLRPEFVNSVKLYQDSVPLFTRYQLESQIEKIFQQDVRLPSGGSIVIDRTEALVAIDINSSQSTKGSDIEETAFNTNLEAADEIAKQLRLRDLGGLIVIDFIDMTLPEHQREVEERLMQAVATDRARVQIGRISRFGLLEMSRQRLRASVSESAYLPCPRCQGRGTIRAIESFAVSMIRMIEEKVVKSQTPGDIQVQVPVEVATYLLNEKRQELTLMEQRHHTHIVVIPNPHLQTPDYKLEKTRAGEQRSASYTLAEPAEFVNPLKEKTAIHEEPVLKDILPQKAAPTVAKAKAPSALQTLFGKFAKLFAAAPQKPAASRGSERTPRAQGQGRHGHRPSQGRGPRPAHHQRRPAGPAPAAAPDLAAPIVEGGSASTGRKNFGGPQNRRRRSDETREPREPREVREPQARRPRPAPAAPLEVVPAPSPAPMVAAPKVIPFVAPRNEEGFHQVETSEAAAPVRLAPERRIPRARPPRVAIPEATELDMVETKRVE